MCCSTPCTAWAWCSRSPSSSWPPGAGDCGRPRCGRKAGRHDAPQQVVDGLALAERDISLSPGINREQVGMVVSHPIAVRFTGPHGVPVPLSDVTRVTVDSSLGESFTFAPSHPPPALPGDRIVRNQSGLAPLIIRYSVRVVVINGSNGVDGGKKQSFVYTSTPCSVGVAVV